MAALNTRKRLGSLWRWLEGGSSPRRIASAPAPDLEIDRDEPGIEPDRIDETAAALVEPSPIRAARLDRTRLARVFDSAHPVRTRDELFGRTVELRALISATLDVGQHAIVHGARGSGKTSLVRVFGDHADQQGAVVIYMACEPDASFADLIWPYLRALPPVALRAEERARFRNDVSAMPEQFGPRAMVELVAERVVTPTIFILDEFDRVTDPRVKAEIAAAMKLLSDSLTNVLFMLVGIARSVAEVIDSHPSLRRHMRVVSLGRIEADSVQALIDAGEAATDLAFDADARQVISRASCGSPFHVRMFCHHAALAALARGSSNVGADDARVGLGSALEQWAAMNVDDARRFVSLVERHPPAKLERVARSAVYGDRLPGEDEEARSLLLGSLVTEGDGSLVFRDSVAPQFLIAYVILAEDATSASGITAPSFRESKNAAHR